MWQSGPAVRETSIESGRGDLREKAVQFFDFCFADIYLLYPSLRCADLSADDAAVQRASPIGDTLWV